MQTQQSLQQQQQRPQVEANWSMNQRLQQLMVTLQMELDEGNREHVDINDQALICNIMQTQ